MNKEEIATLLMEKTDIKTKTEARRQLEAFIEIMKESIIRDGVLSFRGLGVLEVKISKRIQGRNPKTGETVKFSPKKYVKFRIGSDLKEKLNPCYYKH